MFDRDGDGEVDAKEMKKAMQEVGMPEVCYVLHGCK